jgi:hypothetical protein
MLALMLHMEMRRLVLLLEHPNDDSEERRDDRQALNRSRQEYQLPDAPAQIRLCARSRIRGTALRFDFAPNW